MRGWGIGMVRGGGKGSEGKEIGVGEVRGWEG